MDIWFGWFGFYIWAESQFLASLTRWRIWNSCFPVFPPTTSSLTSSKIITIKIFRSVSQFYSNSRSVREHSLSRLSPFVLRWGSAQSVLVRSSLVCSSVGSLICWNAVPFVCSPHFLFLSNCDSPYVCLSVRVSLNWFLCLLACFSIVLVSPVVCYWSVSLSVCFFTDIFLCRFVSLLGCSCICPFLSLSMYSNLSWFLARFIPVY